MSKFHLQHVTLCDVVRSLKRKRVRKEIITPVGCVPRGLHLLPAGREDCYLEIFFSSLLPSPPFSRFPSRNQRSEELTTGRHILFGSACAGRNSCEINRRNTKSEKRIEKKKSKNHNSFLHYFAREVTEQEEKENEKGFHTSHNQSLPSSNNKPRRRQQQQQQQQ